MGLESCCNVCGGLFVVVVAGMEAYLDVTLV